MTEYIDYVCSRCGQLYSLRSPPNFRCSYIGRADGRGRKCNGELKEIQARYGMREDFVKHIRAFARACKEALQQWLRICE